MGPCYSPARRTVPVTTNRGGTRAVQYVIEIRFITDGRLFGYADNRPGDIARDPAHACKCGTAADGFCWLESHWDRAFGVREDLAAEVVPYDPSASPEALAEANRRLRDGVFAGAGPRPTVPAIGGEDRVRAEAQRQRDAAGGPGEVPSV